MSESSFINSVAPIDAVPLTVVSAHHYRVFGTGAFAGNPTTIHEICTFPADSVLLAHSQTLPTIDNAYYLQAAQSGLYRAKCCSHTALLSVCGHALLATGHHLLATTGLRELTLETSAFRHQCKRSGTTGTLLSLPRHDAQQVTDPLLVDRLLTATGLTPLQVDTVLVFPFNVYALITTSLTALQDFPVDAWAWQQLNDLQPGALMLSCALADGAYAFRYFSPWWGKPEDAATGSAHSYLAPYWLQESVRVETLQWSPQGPASAQVLLAADQVWISGRVQAVSE